MEGWLSDLLTASSHAVLSDRVPLVSLMILTATTMLRQRPTYTEPNAPSPALDRMRISWMEPTAGGGGGVSDEWAGQG